jgi:hypothetical protein
MDVISPFGVKRGGGKLFLRSKQGRFSSQGVTASTFFNSLIHNVPKSLPVTCRSKKDCSHTVSIGAYGAFENNLAVYTLRVM